jgi:hypothetical protein
VSTVDKSMEKAVLTKEMKAQRTSQLIYQLVDLVYGVGVVKLCRKELEAEKESLTRGPAEEVEEKKERSPVNTLPVNRHNMINVGINGN